MPATPPSPSGASRSESRLGSHTEVKKHWKRLWHQTKQMDPKPNITAVCLENSRRVTWMRECIVSKVDKHGNAIKLPASASASTFWTTFWSRSLSIETRLVRAASSKCQPLSKQLSEWNHWIVFCSFCHFGSARASPRVPYLSGDFARNLTCETHHGYLAQLTWQLIRYWYC